MTRDDAASRVHASGPSWVHRALMGAGAALLGAWAGYMLSQAARSDWGGYGSTRRGVWVGAGGALGFALGFSFATGRKPRVSGPLPVLSPGLPTGRSVITAKEIAGSGANTAYDAVKDLRPDWLTQQRQAHTFGEIATGVDIPVYMDSQPLGGVSELSTVPAQDVEAIYWLDAGQATTRFGGGNLNGAILIVSKR